MTFGLGLGCPRLTLGTPSGYGHLGGENDCDWLPRLGDDATQYTVIVSVQAVSSSGL